MILVIDALKGLSNQDIALSNYIIKEGRSFLLVFNKWDLIKNQYNEQKKVITKIKEIFFDAKGNFSAISSAETSFPGALFCIIFYS